MKNNSNIAISKLKKRCSDILKNKYIDIQKLDELEKDCLTQLQHTNTKITKCIDLFNTLISDIKALLLREFDDKSLIIYSKIVSTVIDVSPTKPITLFAINIYANETYLEKIQNGDDDFFLQPNSIRQNDDKALEIMFKFREYWPRLSDDNKEYIKNAMKSLINIVEMYIISKDDGNIVTEILLQVGCN